MQKDVALALDTARQLRIPLPSAAAADQVLTAARASGYEHRDLAALFEVLASVAGGSPRNDGLTQNVLHEKGKPCTRSLSE